MTKVRTAEERETLLKEALEKLVRAGQILDECAKRHEARMREMELGVPNEKLPIYSWKDSRYGRLCI